MNSAEIIEKILRRDPDLFFGETAKTFIGWMDHPTKYSGLFLQNLDALRPKRHERTILLGMGGSSSPALFYNEHRSQSKVTVLDTSNPDTLTSTDFSNTNVIAASKSGGTAETRTALDYALANGLSYEDLVIVTDKGSTLEEFANEHGVIWFQGDTTAGGRFSALSPFGLLPALYAGYSVEALEKNLAVNEITSQMIEKALLTVDEILTGSDGITVFMQLPNDPIKSGGSLWLEQLVAETTGKDSRGVIPLPGSSEVAIELSEIMHWQLVAALLATRLGVDPFNQPDVEFAKKNVSVLLEKKEPAVEPPYDMAQVKTSLHDAKYITLQVYAPLGGGDELRSLRDKFTETFAPTTANLGPRYLHSTGQLHKGGPKGIVAVQILVRPTSAPVLVPGRDYTFHELHAAQATGDLQAVRDAGRTAWQFHVDSLTEAAQLFAL
jgi:glucose-6-phosphate isomerase